jgi:hypothetical protein
MDTIPFIIKLPSEDEKSDQMGIFQPDSLIGLQQIPVAVLKKNLRSISEEMVKILDEIKHVGQFKLKEITMQVEISASGGISIIGTASIGGKGAITLKFAE